MAQPVKVVLSVRFFRTATANEPVREWLKELEVQDRKTIGENVKTVQIGWPLGMPLVRKMTKDLWEYASTFTGALPAFCLRSWGMTWFCCMASSRSAGDPSRGFGSGKGPIAPD